MITRLSKHLLAIGFGSLKYKMFHAWLQNTGPLISQSLNNKSCYCYLSRWTRDSDKIAYLLLVFYFCHETSMAKNESVYDTVFEPYGQETLKVLRIWRKNYHISNRHHSKFFVSGTGTRFSKDPKLFGRHNCLCILKTKVFRVTKLRSYFNFYSLNDI